MSENYETYSEILTLDVIKSHLRIFNNNDDEMLKLYSLSAIEYFQEYTGIKLLNEIIQERIIASHKRKIILLHKPIKKLLKLNIKNFYNAIEKIQLNKKEGEIILPRSFENQEINIEYITGYENKELIPKSIIQGILIHISAMYDEGNINNIVNDLKIL